MTCFDFNPTLTMTCPTDFDDQAVEDGARTNALLAMSLFNSSAKLSVMFSLKKITLPWHGSLCHWGYKK